MTTTRDGGVEADPQFLSESVESAIDSVLEQAGADAAKIGGVGTCCFWHSLMGVKENGVPTTPVYLWADTRSSSVVRFLNQHFDQQEIHRRTGCVFHSSYLPAKLLWLSQTDPGIFRSTARWISFGEYFHWRLFRRYLCSHSMASATGLYMQNTRGWDQELLNFLEIPAEKLSPLAHGGETLQELIPSYQSRWRPLRSIPWLPAIGDGACSNIGCGCILPDQLAVMVGTSAALRVMHEADTIEIPPGLWCYRADERRFLIGGALSNGGLLYDWLTDTLQLGDQESLEERIAAEPPDRHHLTVLPYLAGERSMGWHSDARAVIAGLNIGTRPIEILRAGLEAVAYRLAAVAEAIHRTMPGIREVLASGGALLNSRIWMQIVADALGTAVRASAEKEASSRGAALMTLEILGVIESLHALPARVGETFHPHPENHSIYQRARKRQENLYNLLIARSEEY